MLEKMVEHMKRQQQSKAGLRVLLARKYPFSNTDTVLKHMTTEQLDKLELYNIIQMMMKSS